MDTVSASPGLQRAAALAAPRLTVRQATLGTDVFVLDEACSPASLAERLQCLTHQPPLTGFALQMIVKQGTRVWPGEPVHPVGTGGAWRCRFVGIDAQEHPRTVTGAEIVRLLQRLEQGGVDFVKTEHLRAAGAFPAVPAIPAA